MGLHWGQSGAFCWCGDQLWGAIISPVLLREDIFSESYILPRWFCLPRDRSCWRKSSECIVRNRIVPGGFAICGLSVLWPGSWGFVFRDCQSSWNRQVKDGRAGNSCPHPLPVQVQIRHFPQLILCDVFGCLTWLVLLSQMAMELGLAGVCWAWLGSGGKTVQNGATCASLVSKDVPAHGQWRNLVVPQSAHPHSPRAEQCRQLPLPAKDHPDWDLYVRSNCYLPSIITANHMLLEASRAGGACCTNQDELGGCQDDLCT